MRESFDRIKKDEQDKKRSGKTFSRGGAEAAEEGRLDQMGLDNDGSKQPGLSLIYLDSEWRGGMRRLM